MKANETPEKIYMTPSFGEPDNVLLATFSKSHLNFHRDIEYIRTDAFIEKACEFIRKGGKRGDAYIVTEFGEEVFDFVQFAEDFKNYMKRE
jgi:sensor histidine kinase YesM